MKLKMELAYPVAFDSGTELKPLALGDTQDGLDQRDRDSEQMLPYWDLSDTLIDGADAVRKAEAKFLPKFPKEKREDYNFRLEATKYTNIYGDIVESLASKPFEEEISIETAGEKKPVPTEIEDFVEDVDGTGNNLTVFAAQTFFNGINSAIDWILVDYPTIATDDGTITIRTVADQKKAGIRPFWTHVLGRNILQAKSTVLNGKEELTYIRILEPDDGIIRIRIFEKYGENNVIWQLWEETIDSSKRTKTFKLIGFGPVTLGVIPMVPFITGRREGRTFKIHPPMRNAADLQRELYQQESALKFAKIMTAYPMLAAQGIEPRKDAKGNPEPIAIGPAKVLYGGISKSGHAGTWQFIEISASSLTFLQSDIDKTINNLRELGRQPLTAQSGNLTVITTAVAAGKAKSAVAAWGLNLKDALENALVLTCKWFGISDETYSPEVKVYDDYDDFVDNGTDVQGLNAMRAAGDLSQITLWSEMKRRRILSAEFDAEEETKRLLDEVPDDGNPDNEDDPELDENGQPIIKPKLDKDGKPIVDQPVKPTIVPQPEA